MSVNSKLDTDVMSLTCYIPEDSNLLHRLTVGFLSSQLANPKAKKDDVLKALNEHSECTPSCLRYYMIFKPYNTLPRKDINTKTSKQFISVRVNNKEIKQDRDTKSPPDPPS